MAGDIEATEGTGSTNGVPMSREAALADDRAAFLAGTLDGAESIEVEKKPARVAEVDDGDLEDDADADLDADDDLEAEETAAEDVESDEEEDPDADLEDEDEKPGKVDAATAKRLEQVRRTDKRLREQREQMFAAREREIVAREEQLRPRLERMERFDRLAERVRYEPEAVLLELGATEDDLDLATKRLYALTKAGKSDPKVREAVDRLTKEREAAEELRSIKKKLEEQENAAKKQAEEAEARKHIDATLDRFAKAATDRYPLVKTYLAKNPARAREDLYTVAGRIAQKTGAMPDPKAVMIAFEKERRQVLRDHGIDPKALGTTTSVAASSTTKTTQKTGDKKTAKKSTTTVEVDDDSKPWTREDFVRLGGKYD